MRTFFDNLIATVTNTQTGITSGALTTAATIGEVLAQMLLIPFVLIFLLYDGAGIWTFLLRSAPHRLHTRADVAGRRSLTALVSYVRATIAVATVDAVGAWIGLVILGVPLAIPLATLVFLGALVPIIGGILDLHPLAAVLAIAVGLVTAGIAGALLTVPLLAVLNSGIRSPAQPSRRTPTR